ncbi:hypothetical protein M408DRAFT_29151 [Serendipita vermifera MAFF 305830]|uniref:AAA+ ATPase domain-containing protein n=1 Tax=Serendipita vermifera MAFF 305830 TaxID=933852 RepID=A0A0C3AB67_SERVB|nr:hypothetical protein M408DRAFT_29151 [Serendipita vermifera MAFF 305830]
MGAPPHNATIHLAEPFDNSGSRESRIEDHATKSTTTDSSIQPIEAIRKISHYCSPAFNFTKPFQLVAFVKLLNAANTNNANWEEEDVQKVLETVTQQSGMEKLSSIMKHPAIVSQVQDTNAVSFIHTYLGCLSFMATESVLNSNLNQRVDTLYQAFHAHYQQFEDNVMTCMQEMISARSFVESHRLAASGASIFNTLTLVLLGYLSRVKSACLGHPSIPSLVGKVSEWFNEWKLGNFIDGWVPESDHSKKITLRKLKHRVDCLLSIVEREFAYASRASEKAYDPTSSPPIIGSDTQAQSHEISYGHFGSPFGLDPRHDNDFDNIRLISIPPTQEEMMSQTPPYLPENIPEARHHFPKNSMERLLDVQFRLLREELLAPLRHAVQSIIGELRRPSRNMPVQNILAKRGGRYVAQFGQSDSVMVNIYTSFSPVRIATDKRGISIETTVDAPPGSARHTSVKERMEYWRAVSRKRLIQGGLVGLLWKNGPDIQLFFGLISNSAEELISRIESGDKSLHLRIKFFDPKVDLTLMDRSQRAQRNSGNELLLLIEAPVMYESIRPFLSALQREPTSFPFSQYLAYRKLTPGTQPESSPPEYTTNDPDFEWDLSCLRDETESSLFMNPNDQDSIKHAQESLQSSSRLDVSQANAMVHCLTNEFCLIQGPPGTGKSFTGVEIMRVLLANNVGRILLIAFTNHALDHLLRSVLDAEITSDIVRLGSRSNDDQISEYSLEKLERRDSGILQSAHWDRKSAENALNEALKELQDRVVSDTHRDEYMETFCSEHRGELLNPPKWILQIRQENGDGGKEVHNQKAQKKVSLHDFWINGKDIDWIDAQHKSIKRPKRVNTNKFELLRVEGVHNDQNRPSKSGAQIAHGSALDLYERIIRRRFLDEAGLLEMPRIPSTNRSIDQLKEDPMVWLMSHQERCRLNQSWMSEAHQHFLQETRESFLSLKKEFERAQAHYVECQAQVRVDILRNTDIIGYTTTGAAKLTELLKSVNPSILLVEEAGQVLEAHILGSLVPSIEHVILIGDPLQLRPTINNYALSMDHPKGRELYRFDQSTMERLRGDGMPMAQLNTQRRMRPQISSLARKTLYANLEDNDLVKTYPDLIKIREELRDIRINVTLDSRDEANLRNHEPSDNKETNVAMVEVVNVKITEQVLLRTVDNFQGEEADIILLSLVRNPQRGMPGSIGFLKSPNRTNVALTRARHGLYVFGNGHLLAQKSSIWNQVIQEFKDQDAYGSSLPISCHKHPNEVKWVANPYSLVQVSPEGGCLRSCDSRLKCGHTCYLKVFIAKECSCRLLMRYASFSAIRTMRAICLSSVWNHAVGYVLPDIAANGNAGWIAQNAPPVYLLSLSIVDISPITRHDLDMLHSESSSSNLRDVTITLKCRHTFTVETLDCHCDLASVYERDRESKSWIKPILSPEISLEKASCPICHDTIDSPRYGRVVKRGSIDLLERNIASVISNELETIKFGILGINMRFLERTVVEKVMTNPGFDISSDAWKAVQDTRNQLLSNRSDNSVLEAGYYGDKILTLCNLPRTEIRRWCIIVDPLLRIHERCERLLQTASTSQLPLYATSLASLYDVELHLAQEGHASLEAENFALESSRAKIGMKPPRASSQFQVESTWTSIEVRLMVGWLAEKYFFALLQKDGSNRSRLKVWCLFINFIYKSCLKDAKTAGKLSLDTNAYRQKLVSGLFYVKSRWASFQFTMTLLPVAIELAAAGFRLIY